MLFTVIIVKVEWAVGPVPIDDQLGKEVVQQWITNLKASSVSLAVVAFPRMLVFSCYFFACRPKVPFSLMPMDATCSW
jgi:hypothetical protein